MRPVDSSHLAQAGHDQKSGTLQVGFKDGNIYQYYGVSAPIYEAMLRAKSVGRYFNSEIKNKFKSQRLTPPRAKKPSPPL